MNSERSVYASEGFVHVTCKSDFAQLATISRQLGKFWGAGMNLCHSCGDLRFLVVQIVQEERVGGADEGRPAPTGRYIFVSCGVGYHYSLERGRVRRNVRTSEVSGK